MNSVSWFNIPSDNLERAVNFYRDVFGWNPQPLTKEAVAANDFHTVLTGESDDSNWPKAPGVINGCIVKKEMGIPHATILIVVDDLDQAERRLSAAGGQVISERIHINGVNGELFLAKDTEGNVIEVFRFKT